MIIHSSLDRTRKPHKKLNIVTFTKTFLDLSDFKNDKEQRLKHFCCWKYASKINGLEIGYLIVIRDDTLYIRILYCKNLSLSVFYIMYAFLRYIWYFLAIISDFFFCNHNAKMNHFITLSHTFLCYYSWNHFALHHSLFSSYWFWLYLCSSLLYLIFSHNCYKRN